MTITDTMTDQELIKAAIDASGLSASAFARTIIVRHPRTIFRMLSGESPLSDIVREKCLEVLDAAAIPKR